MTVERNEDDWSWRFFPEKVGGNPRSVIEMISLFTGDRCTVRSKQVCNLSCQAIISNSWIFKAVQSPDRMVVQCLVQQIRSR